MTTTHIKEVLYAQACFPYLENKKNTDLEEITKKFILKPDEWQVVTWNIPRIEFQRQGRLRLDPLNTIGTVSISEIELAQSATGEILWKAARKEEFKQCAAEGDVLVFPNAKELVLICTGSNGHLYLPPLTDLTDYPLQLTMRIKGSRQLTLLVSAWQKLKLEKKELVKQFKQQENISKQYYQGLVESEESVIKLTNSLNNQVYSLSNQVASLENQIDQLKTINFQLDNWIDQLDHLFQATMKSNRWRIGNMIVSSLTRLCFRGRNRLVTDQISGIFQDYRNRLKE